MDSKTLVKALKTAVREVIKEELTEILREGLQSTITEMQQPTKTNVSSATRQTTKTKSVQFNDNKWASVLNETDPIIEDGPLVMNNFRDMMNEEIQEIKMTSRDAANFGAMRQNMKEAMGMAPSAPKIMEDPETGKTFEVPQEVQQAMTRDYSALMKAINNKKGR
jgi:Ribonuclease G/E